jgi:hypothetical protein
MTGAPTSHGFLLSNVVAARGRRRSCPCSPLTRSAPGTGTPSLVSPNVPLGVPFATPARGERFLQFGWFHSNPPVHHIPRFLGAGVGVKMVGRMSATLIKLASSHRLPPVDGVDEKTGQPFQLSAFQVSAFSRGITEPTLALRAPTLSRPCNPSAYSAPSIGTVPPAPVTDSPALHPLHSASFQFRRLHFHFTAFRRPQTAETVRRTSGAPETSRPRCCAYRPR